MNRNRKERIQETYNVVKKLNELNLTIIYNPIYILFQIMKKYIDTEEDQEVNIPFYEINKKIIGTFEVDKRKESIIKLIEIN